MAISPIHRKFYHRIGLIVIALFSLFSLLTLGRVPEIPHADDGGYAAAAYNFWQTGHPGVPGFQNILHLNADVFVFGRIAAAFQGFFMWLFGVSLFNAVLPNFLAGLGLLSVTYALGKSLWERNTAILGVTILSASGVFFSASRWARPDMLLTLCFISSLYFLASGPAGKWSWRYVVAGVIMGLSGDVHLNGYLLAPIPIIFWIFMRRERGCLLIITAITYVGGVLAGVLLWLILHYWPDIETFKHQTAVFGGKTHGIQILNLGIVDALWRELGRYLSWFWEARFHRHIFEGATILICGVWVTVFGSRKERVVTLSCVLIFLLAACFMANPYGWYLIYVWPLFALWVSRGIKQFYHFSKRIAVVILSVLFAGYFFNLALWTGKALQGPSYTEITREVRALIPQKASVIAGGEMWFALWDRNFTDAQHVQLRKLESEVFPEKGPAEWEYEWKQLKWEFAVAYEDIQLMLDHEVPLDVAIKSMGVGRINEIYDARVFAAKHCYVIRQIKTASTPIVVFGITGGKENVAR